MNSSRMFSEGNISWSKQRVGKRKSAEASARTLEKGNGFSVNTTDSSLWLIKKMLNSSDWEAE